MRRLGLLLALGLAVSACDDSDDPPAGGPGDGGPDAPPGDTFTAFVIDLVENRTANDTEPVADSEFESLPDPDLENESAYSTLFP